MRARSALAVAALLLGAACSLASGASGCSSFSAEATDETDGGIDAALDATASPEATVDGEPPRSLLRAVWARGVGSANDAGADGASVEAAGTMAVDPSGGVAIGGAYSGGAIASGAGIVAAPDGAAQDAFLLRLDATGAHLGSKRFGDDKAQLAAGVAGTSGTIYATFLLAGTMTFDEGSLVKSTGSNLNSAVARYNAALVSSAHVRMVGTGNVHVRHLANGPSGSAIAFGDWANEIIYEGESAFSRGPAGTGLVVARLFSLSGAQDIVRKDFCPQPAACVASALGSNAVSGESLVGGRFVGELDGVDGGAPLMTSGDDDAYVIKLDSQLNRQWIAAFGGVGSQEVLAIASLPGTGDYIVAGGFDGTFGGTSTQGGLDIFVVRVDVMGKPVWTKTFGGTGTDKVTGIVADDKGNVFFVGTFTSPRLELGGAALVNGDAMGVGSSDVFVGWLDGSGNHVYSARFGDGAVDVGSAIGLDGVGNVIVSGTFERSIDFGSGAALAARGKRDMFVAKLAR